MCRQGLLSKLELSNENHFLNKCLCVRVSVCPCVRVSENRDLELPKWVRKVYPWPMVEPTVLSFVVPTWTTDMKRLRGDIVKIHVCLLSVIVSKPPFQALAFRPITEVVPGVPCRPQGEGRNCSGHVALVSQHLCTVILVYSLPHPRDLTLCNCFISIRRCQKSRRRREVRRKADGETVSCSVPKRTKTLSKEVVLKTKKKPSRPSG
ncbi:unnamed protein product [Nesidiocoris tenuis]|uniref:Uncharacterized protein n=1 Tax=Nesidiocoris tenuis TaxID=355587 RepID=A0A6H5GYM2_9HEMI|nr:unnamed protein product [Nesidiocoris tenuis]